MSSAGVIWSLARIRTGDGEIRNGPILSINPEIKIQAANFALRPFLILAEEFPLKIFGNPGLEGLPGSDVP